VSVALLFPGQGSEEPSMGLALARQDREARELLDHASAACGADVVRTLERGGRDFSRTEVIQPALAAVSLAAARALERRGVRASCVLGHSLGELTAACFSARIDPRAAIDLAAFRGASMARAAAARAGAMAALRCAPAGLALPEGAVLALHNAPDETVVAGDASAIDEVLAHMRGTKLRTAGAWHSPHMQPAVEPMRAKIAETFAGHELAVPLLGAGVGALADALVTPVRFVELLGSIAADHVVVLAPSRTVRALVRRTLGARVELHGADSPADLDALADALGR
jgi:[acyl-carrier-protein] S-malonyltransferase